MDRRLDTRRYLKSRAFLLVLIVALICTFVITTICAINNIVVEQNQIQQKSVTPVFDLVNRELLKPLYLAESFANSFAFEDEIHAEHIDENALIEKLKEMSERFDIMVFLALEKQRRQYMSDGRAFDLKEGEVYWYFEALEEDKTIMADLGQAEDIHLFFDVKVVGKDESFLGYVGVGEPITTFLDKFYEYKSQYGYDFLFVDDNNEIVLTSFADLIIIDQYAPSLADLDVFASSDIDLSNLDSETVTMRNVEYMVSEMAIQELDWRLLLLTPTEMKKATVTKTLLLNAFMTFALVASILAASYALILQYKFSLESSSLTDPLTGLSNRSFLERQYIRLRKKQAMLCVVVCDLDRFKSINDTYGHNVGDEVLKHTAKILKKQFREGDVVGRWGGEEFVILVPSKSADLGIKIAERTRQELANAQIYADGQRIQLTASFGVCFGSAEKPMAKLVGMADVALYQAKDQGRNRVIAKDFYSTVSMDNFRASA